VRHTAVDDVHRVHAALGRIQRTGNLGQHAAADGAVGKQLVNAARGQVGQQLAFLVEHARMLVSSTSFSALSMVGQLGGHHVGVDVVALVVLAKADRADDGDELVVLQGLDHAGVDGRCRPPGPRRAPWSGPCCPPS
jgi:hypothetical protein